MHLRISSELHQQLLAAAAASPDVEICGLLFGDGAVERIVPTANVAPDPRRSFEIDPRPLFAALRCERAGQARLLGYYHSHPTGAPTPSSRDTAQATADGRMWLIIGNGRITAWRMSDARDFNPIAYQVDPSI
jgi:desampylase